MEQNEQMMPNEAEKDPVYIANAGLALLHPFLAMFFARAGLTGDNIFKNDESKARALVLLSYLVSGGGYAYSNEQTLARLMCGMEDVSVSSRDKPITNEERELCDDLLENVIAQWNILKDSSIAASERLSSKGKGHSL